MERRDLSAAGMVHRAEQPLGALLVDAGNPHDVSNDRQRIVGLAGRAVLHRVELRRDRFPCVELVLSRESTVVVSSEFHQVAGHRS